MGSLGGESSSSGCTGPFCTQSTSKYLQQCILLCFLGVVLIWDLWEVEAQVVDAHNLQVKLDRLELRQVKVQAQVCHILMSS
jgi:cell division protein FtsB